MLGCLNLTMATLTLRTSLFCTTWEKNGANQQIEHWQTKMVHISHCSILYYHLVFSSHLLMFVWISGLLS